MQDLIQRYIQKLQKQRSSFQRSAYHFLEENHRLIGIKGARGTGKTTLLLQFAKNQTNYESDVLYASLDNFYFSNHRLYALAEEFSKRGGRILLLDEVHKYEGWARELKNIYDDFDELKVIFTGSSLLEILDAKADLSRRAIVFEIQGLSFREFLAIEHRIQLSHYSLDELINNHAEISQTIVTDIRPFQFFKDYLEYGYYPFFKESKELYPQKLEAVVNLILQIELPQLRKFDISNLSKMKKLLVVLAESAPFKPNISKLSERTKINRVSLLQYVYYLQEAGLTRNLFKNAKGITVFQKPEKLYLDNTNLSYLFSRNLDMGAARETFFVNQLSHFHQIEYAEKGDFLVDGKFTFEVGGRNKSRKQIIHIPSSYRALDDIEYGTGEAIPLWLFGFLY